MKPRHATQIWAFSAAFFALRVLAHGDEHHHEMDMHSDAANTTTTSPPSSATTSLDDLPYYFAHGEHKSFLYLHIITMVVAWVGIMPIAVMLYLASSRYHLPAQLLFLTTTAVGVVFATIYNSLTPDLYPGNAHHKLGWALVWILGAQAMLGVMGSTVRQVRSGSSSREERSRFMSMPLYSAADDAYRHSGDSGHGSSVHASEHDWNNDDEDEAEEQEKPLRLRRWAHTAKLEEVLQKYAPGVFNGRVVAACEFFYSLVARSLVPLAFTQLSLGVVTGSGIFMGERVFNGLAHFIKGGIFFLYGLITLGRYLGAFSDRGWAWNTISTTSPTFEAVESGLMFTYGITNIFLEHLASWGASWSHSDLQHVSIAFLFLGGGLCGLLLESRRIRGFLFPLADTPPMNPLPTLTIFLLGTLMSQHHQHSALSAKIHMQWGVLLAAGSAFRLLTYFGGYVRAPMPEAAAGRPPTEVLAAFCFIVGGAVFMVSNKDTVGYLERSGVDGMFSLTVTAGVGMVVMAWVVVVMSVKGWAAGRETTRSRR